MDISITFKVNGSEQDFQVEGAEDLAQNFDEVKARLIEALDGFHVAWTVGLDLDDEL